MTLRGPIELVLFDLGGTLFYEAGPWDQFYARADASLWNVLHRAGVPVEPRDIYGDARTLFELYARHQALDRRETTMASFLGELLRASGHALDEETVRTALGAMYAVTQGNWSAEGDAIETLQRLRADGLRIGAISNGSDDGNTQSLVDKLGVRPYLEFLVSSAAFGWRKPDPSIFGLALDHFGIPAARSVMVGDNYEADVVGAHGTGMQAIWITRRVAPPLPEMSQGEPEAIVRTLLEIPPLLGKK